jgi:hypothetical protein
MAFTIPSGLFTTYYEVCNELLSSPFTSVECTLNFPPKQEACSCNSVQGASNIAHHGGPAPFFSSTCSQCGGSGYKETPITDTMRLRVDFDQRNWWREAESLQISDAAAKVIGAIQDWHKFKQAKDIELHSDVDMGTHLYTVASEPVPHGFGRDRYFSSFLSKS